MSNTLKEEQNHCIIEFKDGLNRLQLVLLNRLYLSASDDWDRDIINAEIRFTTEFMQGKFAANVWSTELSELRNLFKEVQGKIGESFNKEFALMEDAVKFNISLSKTGSMETEVIVRPKPTGVECTKFILNLDQSYLPSIIISLEDALVNFPVQVKRF